ncbi:MAG TPA: hypothetical protein VER17_14355 [Tepidisphaeraceae bacterium]|nr:hypothetical protein [Tepidisphaeraceae bacterium]
MASNYPPSRDQDLAAVAQDQAAKITATPALYGSNSSEATQFTTLTGNFVTSLNVATDPVTRNKGSVARKNLDRALLATFMRALNNRIQATPTVTAQAKLDLGLPLRDRTPSSRPAPAEKPVVAVVDIESLAHEVRATSEVAPSKRGRPDGVAGIEWFSYVAEQGTTPPADPEAWRYEGQSSRTEYVVDYNAADAGKYATLRCRYFNRKGEYGPFSDPVVKMIAA